MDSYYLAQINPIIGDIRTNTDKVILHLQEAKQAGARIVLFPELALCGYPPLDLLFDSGFMDDVEEALKEIRPHTQGLLAIVGIPRRAEVAYEKPFYNSAAIFADGEILGFEDKTLLPTYDVFDERRYFRAGGKKKVWNWKGINFVVTICEDIWAKFEPHYPEDPLNDLEEEDLDYIFNLSASPYSLYKQSLRKKILVDAAKRTQSTLLLVNQVGAQDGLIFDGKSMAVDSTGKVLAALPGFIEAGGKGCAEYNEKASLFDALVLGIKDYFQKTKQTKAYIGISGGIDSAVVAALAVAAIGKENVTGVMMPSKYTSKRSLDDAAKLAHNLGISLENVSIDPSFEILRANLRKAFQNKPEDITEENLQARLRGIMLMAMANKFQALVLATGNKSELAVGYSTLYGDMCGAIAPIGDLFKMQVYALANWINHEKEVIPNSIIEREPTAELREDQKDSDSLPPYPVLDAILERYIEKRESSGAIALELKLDHHFVEKITRQVRQNEFKRKQGPLILRVTEKAFGSGRLFPIVQNWH